MSQDEDPDNIPDNHDENENIENNENQNENASNPAGEENPDEDDELFEHLPADHPHLRRFQISLEDQLKAEEENFVFYSKKKMKIQKS